MQMCPSLPLTESHTQKHHLLNRHTQKRHLLNRHTQKCHLLNLFQYLAVIPLDPEINSGSGMSVNSRSDIGVNSRSDISVNSGSEISVNSRSEMSVNSRNDEIMSSGFDEVVKWKNPMRSIKSTPGLEFTSCFTDCQIYRGVNKLSKSKVMNRY